MKLRWRKRPSATVLHFNVLTTLGSAFPFAINSNDLVDPDGVHTVSAKKTLGRVEQSISRLSQITGVNGRFKGGTVHAAPLPRAADDFNGEVHRARLCRSERDISDALKARECRAPGTIDQNGL